MELTVGGRVGWNRQIRSDSDGRFRDCSLVLEKQLVQISKDFKHSYPVGIISEISHFWARIKVQYLLGKNA